MERASVLKYVGTTAAAVGLVAAGAAGVSVVNHSIDRENSEYSSIADTKFWEGNNFQATSVDHRGGRGGKGMRHGSNRGLNGLIQEGTLTPEQAETLHENLKAEMQAQRLAAIDKVLADLVANSTLTQEQADQVKSFFESRQNGAAISNTSA